MQIRPQEKEVKRRIRIAKQTFLVPSTNHSTIRLQGLVTPRICERFSLLINTLATCLIMLLLNNHFNLKI